MQRGDPLEDNLIDSHMLDEANAQVKFEKSPGLLYVNKRVIVCDRKREG